MSTYSKEVASYKAEDEYGNLFKITVFQKFTIVRYLEKEEIAPGTKSYKDSLGNHLVPISSNEFERNDGSILKKISD